MKFALQFVFATVCLAQAPDNVTQAIAAMDAKQYDSAVDLLQKAIAADATDAGAHFYLGLAYGITGKDAQAVPEYRKVLELRPGTPSAQVNLAASLFNLEQYKESAEMYRAALESTKSADVELGLGRSLMHLKQLSEAEPHYREAATLAAANRDFLLELAGAFEPVDPQAAIKIYSEFPENPAALERQGVLLMNADKFGEAISVFETSVKLSPTPANHLALAQAYSRNHEPAKAAPHALEALKAEPQDIELGMFYGALLRDQRKFPDAAAQFQKIAQIKPDFAQAWIEFAGMLVLMERYPDALGALQRVRTLQAETAGTFFLRGMVEDRMNLHKEALASYSRFLELSKNEHPDQEFQARQRVRILELEVRKR